MAQISAPLPKVRKDFLSLLDFDAATLEHCLELAAQMKVDRVLGREAPTAQALAGRHVAMLFEKPSLRTRTTFEVAVNELGGTVVGLQADVALGKREPVADVARNLERWVDAVVIRTFSQQLVEEFAAAAPRLHVINALTDQEHPCQIVADCLTMRERWGSLRGRTLAFVGDGNNVASSLAQACMMLGIHMHVASPEGYHLPTAAVQRATAGARFGARLRLFTDPADAVAGADAVYTDTWVSMGQEAEKAERRRVFESFTVDGRLMSGAAPHAIFMHCMPAYRGFEVTGEVMDGPASRAIRQGHNRLHSARGLFAFLLGVR